MISSKTLVVVILLTALCCTVASSVSAAIINLTPSKDNTLYEYDPADGDRSNGAGFHLFAGETAMGELRPVCWHSTSRDTFQLARRSWL